MLEGLPRQELSMYRYLQGSQTLAPGVDDAQCFDELCKAFLALSFSEETQRSIFSVVLGVLSLGNCEMDDTKDEAKFLKKDSVDESADLLGLDPAELGKTLLVRKISVGREVTETRRSPSQAKAARDAFARMIYGRLFKWLIAKINTSFGEEGSGARNFLGVLDIAGFESFETNSLEQLFINLSNEHLQLHFNTHMFKMELADYETEGIDSCAGMTFQDNSDIVALIDAKGGLLFILDEEVSMPKATDQTFIAKVFKAHDKHSRLIVPKFSGSTNFGIRHFAGDVTYTCQGFLEKNVDKPPDEAAALLQSSRLSVLKEIAESLGPEGGESNAKRGGAKKSKTVSSNFRASLAALIEKLNSAEPHFIRCVKPNAEKIPEKFDSKLAMDQLICSGVMEAVKIRQQGFASRIPFSDFLSRYRIIVPRGLQVQIWGSSEPKDVSRHHMEAFLAHMPSALEAVGGVGSENLVLGKTKVFAKSRASTALEKGRDIAIVGFVVDIQRVWRGRSTRRMMKSCQAVFAELDEWCTCNKFYSSPGAQHTAVAKLKTAEAIEDEVARGREIVERVERLPISAPNVISILKVISRMESEAQLVQELHSLAASLDPVQLDKAVARAEEMELPSDRWGNLRTRVRKVKVQLPLIKGMENALASEDRQELQDVYEAVKKAGLHTATDEWIAELKGAELAGKVYNAIEELKAKQKLTDIDKRQKAEIQAKVFAVEEDKKTETTFAAKEAEKKSRQMTVTGLDAEGQDKILEQLAQAAMEYDMAQLEEMLGKATEEGMESSDLEEYYTLLEKLQTEAFLLQAMQEASSRIRVKEKSKSGIRAIQNLIPQAKDRGVDGHLIDEARQQMLIALRQRARSTTHGNVFDHVHPDELKLMQDGYGDLSTCRLLKCASKWKGHYATWALGHRIRGPNVMLSFCKSEIIEALTKVNPKEEKLAAQAFRDILVWMCDRPVSECVRQGYAQSVINIATASQSLADEVYLHIMKQLTDNPSERSIAQGWRLFLLMCQHVQPGPDLDEFVRAFLTRAIARGSGTHVSQDNHLIAKQCIADLNKFHFKPSEPEAQEAALVPVQVHLMDNSTRKLHVPQDATLRDLGDRLAAQLRIHSARDFRFFQRTDGLDMHRLLPESTLLSTVTEKWARLQATTKRASRLLYKRVFLRCDETLQAGDLTHAMLTFRQAMWDYLHYPIREGVDFLSQVAAMLIALDRDHFDPYVEGNKLSGAGVLEELLPEVVLRDLKRSQWAKQILDQYRRIQANLDDGEPRLVKMGRIFSMFQQMKLFGAHCWLGQQVLSVPADKASVPQAPEQICRINTKEPQAEYWVCVDLVGVRFLAVDTAPGCVFERCFFFNSEAVERVLHWGAKQNYVQIVVSAIDQQAHQHGRVPMQIALTSPAALDIAYTIYVVVEAVGKKGLRH